MAVKNMTASVLTRLKNQAKADKISFQMVLQLFAQAELSSVFKLLGRCTARSFSLTARFIGSQHMRKKLIFYSLCLSQKLEKVCGMQICLNGRCVNYDKAIEQSRDTTRMIINHQD
ncbi:MAG: hypothetical protein ACI4EB_07835 [Bilifractor sp.]